MSYIRFYSNYTLDSESLEKEAVFVDLKTSKRFSIKGVTTSAVHRIFSKSWEETNYELKNIALVLMKSGIAYLADDYARMLENVDERIIEDELFQQKMLGWYNQLATSRKASSYSISKVNLIAG